MPIKTFKTIAEEMDTKGFTPLPQDGINGDEFESWLTEEFTSCFWTLPSWPFLYNKNQDGVKIASELNNIELLNKPIFNTISNLSKVLLSCNFEYNNLVESFKSIWEVEYSQIDLHDVLCSFKQDKDEIRENVA